MPTDDAPTPRPENEKPEYESRIHEVIAQLYEAIDVLKQVDHSKEARERERDMSGRWCNVEKMLISARNASDGALELIRVVDGWPKERPMIRNLKTE